MRTGTLSQVYFSGTPPLDQGRDEGVCCYDERRSQESEGAANDRRRRLMTDERDDAGFVDGEAIEVKGEEERIEAMGRTNVSHWRESKIPEEIANQDLRRREGFKPIDSVWNSL